MPSWGSSTCSVASDASSWHTWRLHALAQRGHGGLAVEQSAWHTPFGGQRPQPIALATQQAGRVDDHRHDFRMV